MTTQGRPARTMIGIASGKGGVGKSTIALNLAVAAAELGRRTGLLDADLYGPDVPAMMGLTRRVDAQFITLTHRGRRKLTPVEHCGIAVMSSQFFMGESQAIAIPGGLAEVLLNRMLWDVEWGDLDVLVVDLPPGTADVQQQVFSRIGLDGVVIVVTPQEVAHLDARKVLTALQQSPVTVFGGIENMTSFVCPHCGEHSPLFPPVAPDRSVWAAGLRRLAQLPHSVELATASQRGVPLFEIDPHGPAAQIIRGVARDLLAGE